MQDLKDSSGKPMTAQERAFWENVAACCISGHPSVPDARADTNVVKRAFSWADEALDVYRERLGK